jgi:hypothetical protein
MFIWSNGAMSSLLRPSRLNWLTMASLTEIRIVRVPPVSQLDQ